MDNNYYRQIETVRGATTALSFKLKKAVCQNELLSCLGNFFYKRNGYFVYCRADFRLFNPGN